jgi:hypothetical protein
LLDGAISRPGREQTGHSQEKTNVRTERISQSS